MMATGIRGIAKAAFACVLAFALAPAAMAAGAVEGEQGFDHLKTGFALIGAHQSARCESCHVRGVLRGTPRDCASCHGAGARIVGATRTPANHVPITKSCDSCHQTTVWMLSRFDHSSLGGASCASCHNGGSADGKSATHISTSADCNQCHRTNAWLPATFDHNKVAKGGCNT